MVVFYKNYFFLFKINNFLVFEYFVLY
jgi:hypothetical protein